MSARNVHFLLSLRNQLKLFHWQTHGYSSHVALDGIVSALDEKMDLFVEVYMGKYGRPRLGKGTNTIVLGNLGKASMATYAKDAIAYLTAWKLPAKDTDLANIRDEMLAELNKLLYLLTLK